MTSITTRHAARGWNAFADTLNAGGNVAGLLSALSLVTGQQTADAFGGAVSGLLNCYAQIHGAGVRPKFNDDAIDSLLAHSPATIAAIMEAECSARAPGLGAKLWAIVRVVETNRDRFTISAIEPTPTPQPTAPGEPFAVRVVGMPDRETTTSVKHDSDGNIVAASTVEKDVVPAG